MGQVQLCRPANQNALRLATMLEGPAIQDIDFTYDGRFGAIPLNFRRLARKLRTGAIPVRPGGPSEQGVAGTYIYFSDTIVLNAWDAETLVHEAAHALQDLVDFDDYSPAVEALAFIVEWLYKINARAPSPGDRPAAIAAFVQQNQQAPSSARDGLWKNLNLACLACIKAKKLYEPRPKLLKKKHILDIENELSRFPVYRGRTLHYYNFDGVRRCKV